MKLERLTLYLVLLLIITSFVPRTSAQGDGETAVPRFVPADCPFPIVNGRTVECGFLVVPADHFNEGGQTFRLAVSILRSDHNNPLPEPILFLNGGPGDETAFLAGAQGLPLMATSRWDMIFLDQRGVGYSEPNLNCPAGGLEAATGFDLSTGGTDILEEILAARQTAFESCHTYLVQQGLDLSLFTSAQIAADAAVLRRVLDIQSLNVYAFSFGTVPAQLLIRDYPEGIRTVVLDSPLPLEVAFFVERPRQSAAAFEGLFAACNEDLACRIAYPNLEEKLTELVRELNQEPITLTLTNEETGQTITQVVDGDLLASYLGSLVNGVSTLVEIPGLIYDLSNGDTRHLSLLVEPAFSRSLALESGMATSVYCNEFARPDTAEAVQTAAKGLPAIYTHSALSSTLFDITICESWRSGLSDPEQVSPATGSTPTLILSGQYDFSLPPAWGEFIANHLENGYFYEVPGVGHSVLGEACPIGMTLAFLADPTTSPSARCLESMDQPEFILSKATSRPWARTAVLLLTGLVLTTAGWSGLGYLGRQGPGKRPSFTWASSLRMVNWLPTLGGIVLIGLALLSANGGEFLFDIPALGAGSVLGIILPLVIGIQAAFLFSPEDEPGLEIALAAPRPIAWTALERLAWVLLVQIAVGLVGTFIGRSLTGIDEALWVSLARWLVPVIFFAGIGLMLTISSRHAVFGTTMTMISWFSLALFGDNIVIKWPFLWPIHIFLKPETLPLDDYMLNRGLIVGLGLIMLIRAVYLLRDEEQVLFGRPGKRIGSNKNPKPPAMGMTNVLVTPESRANLGWSLAQVGSIVRAELRLQWRRRAMLVLMLTILVFPILVAFVIGGDVNTAAQSLIEAGIITPEEARERVANAVAPFTFAPIYLAMIMMVPPIAAELIPKDRQLGVSELLESTPLSIPVYLAGKVLGFWVSSLIGLVSVMLISMVAWRLILGPYAVQPVLGMWLIGGGGILVLNGSLAVLLAAGQQSRRWAALIGLVLAVVSTIMFSSAVGAEAVDFLYLNNLARPALLDYFMLTSLRNSLPTSIISIVALEDVWLTIVIGFGQLFLTAVIMWRWLVHRNGR